MDAAQSTLPPVWCTLVERKATTRLFTIPEFSKWDTTPLGTALDFNFFLFRECVCRFKVYPAGFDGADAGFVAVFLNGLYDTGDSTTKVLFKILDARGQRAVFDGSTARSEQTTVRGRDRGYLRFVGTRELLEASPPCVRDDGGLTLRCTVSVDLNVVRPIEKMEDTVAAFSVGSPPRPPSWTPALPYWCSRRITDTVTKLCTVTEYSKWARQVRPSYSLDSDWSDHNDNERSWRIRVYPAGFSGDNGDFIAVFVASTERKLLQNSRVSIQILDESGETTVFDDRTAKSEVTEVARNPGLEQFSDYQKGYVWFVGRKELEASSCLRGDDSFTVRCSVSVDLEDTEWLFGSSPPSSCRPVVEKRSGPKQHEE